jgi:hypothetical protein
MGGFYMLARINFHEFQKIMNRTYSGTSFDYDGLQILYDYFEEMNEDHIIDPVGICCDYSQMTFDEVCEYYSVDIVDNDIKKSVIDFVCDKSHLIDYNDNSVVFVSF